MKKNNLKMNEKKISWKVMKIMAVQGIGHHKLLKFANKIKKQEKESKNNITSKL